MNPQQVWKIFTCSSELRKKHFYLRILNMHYHLPSINFCSCYSRAQFLLLLLIYCFLLFHHHSLEYHITLDCHTVHIQSGL